MTSKLRPPRFSVVMPVHNKGPHVRRSIQSVLDQSFPDLELIIVDDASTDDSCEKINQFDDKRLRVLRRVRPGPGGYAARNLGIRESRGTLIAFIDADDEWCSDHLERMNDVVNRFPDCRAYSSGWKYQDNGSCYTDPHFESYHELGSHRIGISPYLRRFLSGKGPMWTGVVVVASDSPLLPDLFPETIDAKRGGDLHTWLKLILHHEQIAWSDHIGAVYYQNSVNMVTKTAPSSYKLLTRHGFRDLSRGLTVVQRRLLRQYFNRQLTNGWVNNMLNDRENYWLPGKLIWSLDALDAAKYSAFSYLPKGLARRILAARRRERSARRVLDVPHSS